MSEKTQKKSEEVWSQEIGEVVSGLSYIVHFHNCTIDKVTVNQTGIPSGDPGGNPPPPGP